MARAGFWMNVLATVVIWLAILGMYGGLR
jgi:hypothetical protein